MFNRRSFRFWAWLNAGLWILSFAGLYFWMIFAFSDSNPMSPTFCGLTSGAISDIRTTFLEIYLPYLGVIVTSAVTLQRKKHLKSCEMEGLLPLLVLGLGVFFNGGVAKTLYDFIHHTPPDYQILLKDLRIFAAALAFFMAGALSYFYDLGWECDEKISQ